MAILPSQLSFSLTLALSSRRLFAALVGVALALGAPAAALSQPAASAAAPEGATAAPASSAAPAPAPDPAAPDAAAPTPAPGAAAPTPAPGAQGGATPLALKHTCMAAINNDQEWTNELRGMVQKRMTFEAHDADAKLIALNKRHVVMAYAALWLLAVGFLLMQWRRQQALREQLEALRRELGAALQENAK